jgi:hypothetical protein
MSPGEVLLLWLGAVMVGGLLCVAADVYVEFRLLAEWRKFMDKTSDEKRPELHFDFNGNGVPDYREPWFWRGLWSGVQWAVLTFAKPHTLAYRGVVAAQRARAEVASGTPYVNP